MSDLTPADFISTRERHYEDARGFCDSCCLRRPCEVGELLAALDAAVKERDYYRAHYNNVKDDLVRETAHRLWAESRLPPVAPQWHHQLEHVKREWFTRARERLLAVLP